jgi:hypothetical protein
MVPVLTVALALVASLSVAGTQNNGVARPSLPFMLGFVKDVSPETVTLDVGGNAVTFTIDKTTRVIQSGRRKGSLAYRGPERPRTIRDFVKLGDRAQVSYRQFEDKLLAVELRVAPAK